MWENEHTSKHAGSVKKSLEALQLYKRTSILQVQKLQIESFFLPI